MGCSAATASRNPRIEKNSVSRSGTDCAASNPSTMDRWLAIVSHSSPTAARTAAASLSSATSTGSLSKIPVSCFNCAAKAPYALLSR